MSMRRTRPARTWLLRAPLILGMAGALFLVTSNHRRASLANVQGIDPLDALNLQVKPNIYFVIDTSNSMNQPPDASVNTGGDDRASRLYQAKKAVARVVALNAGKANYGMGTYFPAPSASTPAAEASNKDIIDGLFYVTSDDVPGQDPAADTDWNGYFNGRNTSFGNYDNTANSAETFASFGNSGTADYQLGTAARRYYLLSNLYRGNVRVQWDTSVGTRSTGWVSTTSLGSECPVTPPAGLVEDGPGPDGLGRAPLKRNCIQFEDVRASGTKKKTVTYFFVGVEYGNVGGAGNCTGSAPVIGVSSCTQDVSSSIVDAMNLQIVTDANGNPQFGAGAPADLIQNNVNPEGTVDSWGVAAGIRCGNSTPIAASIRTAGDHFESVIAARPAAVKGLQKNFLIVLTDGDDTCAGGTTDQNAIIAAGEAQNLYSPDFGAGSPYNGDVDNRVETFLVAFTTSVNKARADKIARAGSGGTVSGSTVIGGTRDAFTANNLDELVTALQSAIDQAVNTGEFLAQEPVTDNVYEYANNGVTISTLGGAEPPHPLSPKARYLGVVPTLYEAKFSLPGYDGQFRAFQNVSGVKTEKWNAGQKLTTLVTNGMGTCTSSGTAGECAFAELHADSTPDAIASSTAKIKRRIWTTVQNGRFLGDNIDVTDLMDYDLPSAQVPLWPPPTATFAGCANGVDPADVNTAGCLDAALKIDAASIPLLATYQSEFGACLVTADAPAVAVPSDCTTDNDRARKEARETLLAFLAGAQPKLGSDGKPKRRSSDRAILYVARSWALRDTTLAAPALVGPPVAPDPEQHVDEYHYLINGPRNASQVNPITAGAQEFMGFGLRNPDDDAAAPDFVTGSPTSGRDTRYHLKPAMSVVYLPANDMLHAFRAGPCITGQNGCNDTGGEELWGFLPFDQLNKVRPMIQQPDRDDHVYVVASSLRFSTVWVPHTAGTWSKTVNGTSMSGAGVWRQLLYMGRGIGGRYYTALDVTGVGPFTRSALSTKPPIVYWNRGNPDTTNGLSGGTAVRSADTSLYTGMGETWSTPAIAYVDPASNGGREFVVFTGSGYPGTSAGCGTEGTVFYTLDPLTGDIVRGLYTGVHTAPPSGGVDCNALVAGPATFNTAQLAPGTQLGNPHSAKTTRVYIPDLKGRVWKFLASSGANVFANLGSNHPMANAPALLNYNGDSSGEKPHVFLESGNDSRVDGPFFLYGLRDDSGSDTIEGSFDEAARLFEIQLPDGYRGTAQPATAFADLQGFLGRVFFVATKYVPVGDDCKSRFDSIIYGLGAASGDKAYNYSGDYVYVQGQKIVSVSAVAGAGQSQTLTSVVAGSTDAPPPPGLNPAQSSSTLAVVSKTAVPASAVCR